MRPLTLKEVCKHVRVGMIKRALTVWKSLLIGSTKAERPSELEKTFEEIPEEVAPEVRLRRFLIGVWEETAVNWGWATETLTIRYNLDGTFIGTRLVSLVAWDVSMHTFPMQGSWD